MPCRSLHRDQETKPTALPRRETPKHTPPKYVKSVRLVLYAQASIPIGIEATGYFFGIGVGTLPRFADDLVYLPLALRNTAFSLFAVTHSRGRALIAFTHARSSQARLSSGDA